MDRAILSKPKLRIDIDSFHSGFPFCRKTFFCFRRYPTAVVVVVAVAVVVAGDVKAASDVKAAGDYVSV